MLKKLNRMINDLSKYKRDKNSLLEMYIKERLDKSLEVYYNQLNYSLDVLMKRDSLRVMKQSNKLKE
ncbi:MAG: hypothetical protein J6T10_28840 [Methanobrevibacter sp.]|nr:hypothetical protein [Methanobrevibacter sp.]